MDKKLEKNARVQAVIEGYSSQGMGIARYEGFVIFVPGAVCGEECIIQIVKPGKSFAYGKVMEILVPSPNRVSPCCSAYPSCGGCDFLHVTYEEELRIKAGIVTDAMNRIGGFSLDTVSITPSPREYHYRNKAQYPVGVAGQGISFGFYRKRSHEIIPHKGCLIQSPQAESLARIVCEWANTYHIKSYENGAGILRHILVRSEGDMLQLCLVSAKPDIPRLDKLIDACRHIPGLKGICINLNNHPGNRILGDKTICVMGEDKLSVTLCGLEFRLSPESFYQVNPFQTQLLYERALEYAALKNDEAALDLYCGIGTITLYAAGMCKSVIGVELSKKAVENAKENAKHNGINNSEFICADAAKAAAELLQRGIAPEVVICDPPRKGLDPAGIDAICNMTPRRIVYIACDPASLARDCAQFREKGYELEKISAFDMFPKTANVETVVLLSRKTPNDVIHVDLELDEMDVTSAETKATYREIKDYVLDKFGFKVSQLYIAQVKRKHGIIERENYNKPRSEDTKVPQCPQEKEAAILDTLRYFEMV